MSDSHVPRRGFLKALGVIAIATPILQACGAPTPTAKPAATAATT